MAELTQSVSIDTEGSVAVITVDNPPVNALSWHVRQGIFDGLNQATSTGAQAVVLLCAGRTFIAGADISEFGGNVPESASLADLQAVMENATIPVIAAIHGTALGGGLEVALAAHYRVGLTSSKYGLPEVNIGLLPGAGGTQRLPRLVGVPKALEAMTSGRHIPAAEAVADGLIDEMIDGNWDALRAGAVSFAEQAVAQNMPLVKVRDRNDKVEGVDPQVFADFRTKIARKTRGFLAPDYNIQCIEAAASLPFDEGLKVESRLFRELMTGPQSAAQRYYFFAERAANKIPDIAKETPTIEVKKAGVLGAGTMGGGIAMNFANVGISVTIVEVSGEALERGLSVVRKNYERSASRGSIPAEAVEERMALITGSTDKNDFADCDIVIEAVFEDMELKKAIFAELDQICKPGAIMASNTSALDVNEIASATSRPEWVIGMHFFSPANVMKLLENVRGDKSNDTVVASTMAIGKQIGKVCAMVGVCRGFVGNRMLAMRGAEAEKMLMEGATPAQIDSVLHEFGFPMGPFSMSDLAGLDIGWKAEKSTSSTVREVMCESGRRGQKNGRGYYTYDPDTRAATPDPDVEQMIRDFAEARGHEQREVTDQEILERLLYPMVNEGAKILDEGIAIRGSDVDVVWVNGYGWPMYRGGPMHWADSVGLAEIVDKIKDYGERLGGAHWGLSPLLERLAADGGSLASHQNGS
ncbi:MAG: 3-hydroxyacyl-CoA dehydrogenase NAD-binding domain-containing protein [Acidimicrobiales bacterium]|nr:3-hydroxyacyl-CoA dehydrogenase NAD-binding domain-containing protein [Acidimicrobiales bacterium]MDG1876462.1 3-hydroxyacyl-CoA dehydrogenase NAD-binding domain-containing protein [Acidimicrobiales bacterium]